MACREAVPDERVESYALGRLDDVEMASFEEHFFDCPECLSRLETLQALPAALRSRAERAPGTKGRAPHRLWLPVGAGLAAGVALVAAGWLSYRLATGRPGESSTASSQAASPPPASAAALVEWARISPPRFRPPSLRGLQPEPPELRAAMEAYVRSDYAGASARLERAVRRHPREAAVLFFLGASHLLTGRIPEGIVRLEETIALGESPYLEEARLTLAKALVREGRLDEAATQLEKALELRGDLEDEAREGLLRIHESRPR